MCHITSAKSAPKAMILDVKSKSSVFGPICLEKKQKKIGLCVKTIAEEIYIEVWLDHNNIPDSISKEGNNQLCVLQTLCQRSHAKAISRTNQDVKEPTVKKADVEKVCNRVDHSKEPSLYSIPKEAYKLPVESNPSIFREFFQLCLLDGLFPVWKRQNLELSGFQSSFHCAYQNATTSKSIVI